MRPALNSSIANAHWNGKNEKPCEDILLSQTLVIANIGCFTQYPPLLHLTSNSGLNSNVRILSCQNPKLLEMTKSPTVAKEVSTKKVKEVGLPGNCCLPDNKRQTGTHLFSFSLSSCSLFFLTEMQKQCLEMQQPFCNHEGESHMLRASECLILPGAAAPALGGTLQNMLHVRRINLFF